MIQPIILAAGKGTRMQSDVPKPLYPVDGKPMIQHVIDALARDDKCIPPLIVVGAHSDAIRDALGHAHRFVVQQEANGTAGAVMACLPDLARDADHSPVLILYADHPFITIESIVRIRETFERERPTLAFFTVTVPDFSDWRAPFNTFGRIVRDSNGTLERIVEYKNATEAERDIREVNPGVYCVDAMWLIDAITRIETNPVNGEYYLTDLVELATLDGGKIVTVPLPPEEALGINSIEDAQAAEWRSR